MDLIRALRLPFQSQSLLLVGFTSLTLALVTSIGSEISPARILAVYIISVWLNRFAFAMLDAAANGERETPVASVELLGPFSDPRSWVHPLLAAAVFITLVLLPQLPRIPVLAAAALLLPLSLAAIAFTDRIADAVNPLALWRTLRGLAQGYLLLLAGLVLCCLAGWILWRLPVWKLLQFVGTVLLFFCYYALTGGVLFWRRNALGFSPRHSPERAAERKETEREVALQRIIDEIFVAVRARKLPRAVAALSGWLESAPPERHAEDVQVLLHAGVGWNEPRSYPLLLNALIERFCEERRLSLALRVADHALLQSATFAPPTEACCIALIRHAAQNGRRKLAVQLLDNALSRAGGQGAPALEALRVELPG